MNVKTRTLTGGEIAVKFDANHSYFWVLNLSDSDMYMSVSPNITPDADGVILIPAKSGGSTGDVGQCNTLYLLGSGKVQIFAQYNAVCPFKNAEKGGDNGGSIDLTDYALEADLTSHTDDKSNPHNVTAEQIKYRNVVDMYNQPISYLQNTILNWLKYAVETLSVFCFYGNSNVDFYIDNWENNSSAIDRGDRSIYTVKMLGSASGAGGRYLFATFLITTTIPRRDGNYSADSFMVTYSDPEWYMYGKLVTETSLNAALNDAIRIKSKITANTDWNTITTAGIYIVSNSAALSDADNAPDGAYGYGVLLVIHNPQISQDIYQIYVSGNRKWYQRERYNGLWKDWSQINK